MKPKLSILVPIYNVEKYLSQCLESITEQTLQDIEIICINDGSTDGSLDIIKDFAKNDNRIVIIDKPNSGYGDSMNQGLEKATGEYIGIVESDDWIELDAFERLYQIARKNKADVVKANYYKVRNNVDVEKVAEIPTREVMCPAEDRKVFLFAPAIWSAIYRRDFLRENGIKFLPTPGASYQDLSFSFKVWALARTVVLVSEAFVHYRVDNANSSVNNPGKVNCVVDEYAEIETFLCERGIFEKFGEIMDTAKFRNYHWNFQRLNKKLAKEFYQTWRQEFLSAEEEGILKKENFSKKDWMALKVILHHPKLAYLILRARIALKQHLY